MTVIFEMRASIGEIKDGSRKDWDSLQNTCSSLLYWIWMTPYCTEFVNKFLSVHFYPFFTRINVMFYHLHTLPE